MTDSIHCPQCGTLARQDQKFCESCGTELPQIISTVNKQNNASNIGLFDPSHMNYVLQE
ncbi:MAG: zinc ribbon domain-containing protein, partial [Promethearchaeota archaeon]